MKTLKSVEIFYDVVCENCVSFDEGQCCKELPPIPVGKDKKIDNEESYRQKKMPVTQRAKVRIRG